MKSTNLYNVLFTENNSAGDDSLEEISRYHDLVGDEFASMPGWEVSKYYDKNSPSKILFRTTLRNDELGVFVTLSSTKSRAYVNLSFEKIVDLKHSERFVKTIPQFTRLFLFRNAGYNTHTSSAADSLPPDPDNTAKLIKQAIAVVVEL